jgi:hypothetical protein
VSHGRYSASLCRQRGNEGTKEYNTNKFNEHKRGILTEILTVNLPVSRGRWSAILCRRRGRSARVPLFWSDPPASYPVNEKKGRRSDYLTVEARVGLFLGQTLLHHTLLMKKKRKEK